MATFSKRCGDREYLPSIIILIYMIVLFFIIAIIFLLLNYRGKANLFWIIYALSVLTVLNAGNDTNLDWANYNESYYLYDLGHNTEWLYIALKTFSNVKLGLSYEYFRLFITSIAFVLFFFSIKYYIPIKSKYFSQIILLFIIFPFFLNIPIHRNFLSSMVLMFSLRYLDRFSLKNLILFLLTIFVASGIQFTFIAYIILIIVYLLRDNPKVQSVYKYVIFLSLLLMLMPDNIISLVQGIMSSVGEDRNNYTEEIGTRYGYIVFFAEQMLMYLIARNGYKSLLESQIPNCYLKDFVETAMLVTFVCIVFCPLYRVQGNFARLLNNQILIIYLQYGCVSMLSQKYNLHSKGISQYKIQVWAFSFFFLAYVLLLSHTDDIILRALKDNWIFRFMNLE